MARKVDGHYSAVVELAQGFHLLVQCLFDFAIVWLHELGNLAIRLLRLSVLILERLKNFVQKIQCDWVSFIQSPVHSVRQSCVCVLLFELTTANFV